jgi:glucose-6-phosphate dehydrogenase assembly protein OpcA
MFPNQQIKVPETLDVEAVERELAKLWVKTTRSPDVELESAVMRARVANLLIFTSTVARFPAINETLAELSSAHPCRALVVAAEKDGTERDIEMFISSFSQSGVSADTRNLSCEEVILIARGKFVAELPSATLPLLIPDLPVFLWWCDRFSLLDSLFRGLSHAADRLIVDSVDFPSDSLADIAEMTRNPDYKRLGISDINWARLTSWRALLASFYDVPEYRTALDSVNSVQIDYVAPNDQLEGVAPQALLIGGWLASCLGWQPMIESRESGKGYQRIQLTKTERRIALEFRQVERPDMKHGRLARVELKSESESAAFLVIRSDSGLHLEAQGDINGQIQPGQLLAVRNRSTAQLLAREMEILCNDDVYAGALAMVVVMGS